MTDLGVLANEVNDMLGQFEQEARRHLDMSTEAERSAT